jgi:hypothetical protein
MSLIDHAWSDTTANFANDEFELRELERMALID